MGIFKNKKIARRSAIIFAGTLVFTTVVYGATITKKIDATFRNIKVFYNNQQKTMEQEPFIYNGSVYLPVRGVGELVDKNIQWDSAQNAVYVSDKGEAVSNTLVQQLQSEIAAKNFEIAKITAEKAILDSKIKELQGNDKDSGSGTTGNLKTTLKHLEDYFDYEHQIDWDFSLKESGSRINVEISYDSRTDGKKWDKLTKKQQETFFKEICREIRIDHKDATLNGKVLDRRTDKTVGTFNYSKSNSFSYTQEDSSSFNDLERALARIHKDIGKKINVDEIRLEGDEDNITFTVVVDLGSKTTLRDWEDLADKEVYEGSRVIRDFMYDVEDEILRDYKYATVDGYIVDYANRNEMIASYEKGTLTKPRR